MQLFNPPKEHGGFLDHCTLLGAGFFDRGLGVFG
jgi:hypothetical protein